MLLKIDPILYIQTRHSMPSARCLFDGRLSPYKQDKNVAIFIVLLITVKNKSDFIIH